MKILAIDFETADHGRDSACAVGVAMIEDGRITDEYYELICPPRRQVWFTAVHGLTWKDLSDKAPFAEVWLRLADFVVRADVLAAHNASFDRAVLAGCAQASDIVLPVRPWLCTLQLSRAHWSLGSYSLSSVCSHLDIELDHHHALSDARGCASVVLSAQKLGRDLNPYLRH